MTVTVGRRLRPIRLMFLIRPNDRRAFRNAVQINTCLWGGQFNPIVPVYKRTPKWWAQLPMRAPSAKALLNGYLDAFEPDYVVEAGEDLGRGLTFPQGRVLRADKVLPEGREEMMGHGVDVRQVFWHLYQEEFQFERRHPLEVVVPVPAEVRLAPFVAACFGEFPHQPELADFLNHYRKAFDASEVKVEASNLFALLMGREGYPLRTASTQLEVLRRGWRGGPALFFMDATSLIDLTDFWNLRAIGWQVLPLPRQWAEDLGASCEELIERCYVPYPHNKPLMHWTTLLRARSVEAREAQEFAHQLRTPGPRALVYQSWYPRMWDEWARNKGHVARCDLVALESDLDAGVRSGSISFRELCPDFAEHYSERDTPRWANVIHIRDYSPSEEVAAIIPPRLPGLPRILQAYGGREVWTTREGLTLACQHKDRTRRLRLPTRLDVFEAWMKGHSFDLEVSGAGKIAAEVIGALGGLSRVGLIAEEELITRLNQMAHGLVEGCGSEQEERVHKTKVRARTVPKKAMLDLLLKVKRNNQHMASRCLDLLIEHKVLQVGLRLQCPQCSQHTWYALGELDETLRCERCLRMFNFPAAAPPERAWHYRCIGPFAIGDYAQGGYCVALALRVFCSGFEGEGTWITSFELRGRDGATLEADFGVFWRQPMFGPGDATLVLGECKSYKRFERKDVERMKALAAAFPGAVLCFCTFRKTLEPAERKLIGRLAIRGRKPFRAERWRNPVLVLTGVELFDGRLPPKCWKEAGEPYSSFDSQDRPFRNLEELCDAGQQLHLKMEPYWTWFEKERQKNRSRRARKE